MLEGLHAVKHARRFGAAFITVAVSRREQAARLADKLAPDIKEWLIDSAVAVGEEVLARLSPHPPDTGVAALARRPEFDARAVLAEGGSPAGDHFGRLKDAPTVLLEDPTHPGNVGAAIRAAASAGARGVIATGPHDAWHAGAIRGSAGLHYALPVGNVSDLAALDTCGRPLLAIHPEGEPLEAGGIPSDGVLAFGSERRGLSHDLLRKADDRISIPMEPGVSSLNLATAVAVTLYVWRLGPGLPP